MALRLWQLRPADDSHGVARRGHLSHRGRAQRRWYGHAALAWERQNIGVQHLPCSQVIHYFGDVWIIKPATFLSQNADNDVGSANQGKQFIRACVTRCFHATTISGAAPRFFHE